MRKLLIASFATVLAALFGCDSNPVYFRMAADYFPVSPSGMTWEYSIQGGGSRIVTVVDQVIIGQRPCWRFQSGADYTYWINESGKLERYENRTVLFNGFQVPLYQGWVTMLEWPLANGMTRTDSVEAQAVSQGVTLSHVWRRDQTVSGPEPSPDGQWGNCYRVFQEETVINWIQTAGFSPETTLTYRSIWLAPDVGIVAIHTADSVLTLTGFSGNGD